MTSYQSLDGSLWLGRTMTTEMINHHQYWHPHTVLSYDEQIELVRAIIRRTTTKKSQS